MSLVIIPEVALRQIETAIVGATHGLTDTANERVTINTIDPRRLKAAALIALQMCIDAVVWPGDEVLHIKQPRQTRGVVEVG